LLAERRCKHRSCGMEATAVRDISEPEQKEEENRRKREGTQQLCAG